MASSSFPEPRHSRGTHTHMQVGDIHTNQITCPGLGAYIVQGRASKNMSREAESEGSGLSEERGGYSLLL